MNSLKDFLNSHPNVDETEGIETKYNIVPDNDNLWPMDNLKRALGEMQQLSEKSKLLLSLVVLSQATRKQKAIGKAETEKLFIVGEGLESGLGNDFRLSLNLGPRGHWTCTMCVGWLHQRNVFKMKKEQQRH